MIQRLCAILLATAILSPALPAAQGKQPGIGSAKLDFILYSGTIRTYV